MTRHDQVWSSGLLLLTSGATVTNPVNGPAPDGEAGKPIAVFLLDDHEVVRRGVRDLLEAEPDIRVVGEAGTGFRAGPDPGAAPGRGCPGCAAAGRRRGVGVPGDPVPDARGGLLDADLVRR